MKYDLKIEHNDIISLEDIINKCYFDNNTGKLSNKDNNHIDINNDNENHYLFKGLNNIIVRLINSEIIEGYMKFVVSEENDIIKLYPCSIYCIVEDDKYSFY